MIKQEGIPHDSPTIRSMAGVTANFELTAVWGLGVRSYYEKNPDHSKSDPPDHFHPFIPNLLAANVCAGRTTTALNIPLQR